MSDKFKERQPDQRTTLVNRSRRDFYQLEQQLGLGLQLLLELENVPVEVRKIVSEYMRDVLQGVGQLKAEVVKLANLLDGPESSHGVETPDMDPKEHGHLNLSDLFKEIRQDEAAGKGEDAHWYGNSLEPKVREVWEDPAAAKCSFEEMLDEKSRRMALRSQEPDRGQER